MLVCAIIVAFNNPFELKKTISSIAQQSYQPEEVVIVDNSHESYKPANKEITSGTAILTKYIALSENLGSAGGFAKGMKYAYEKGYDYMWLLDQDGFAEKDCLANLLKYSSNGDILCPIVLDSKTGRELGDFRSCLNLFGKPIPCTRDEKNLYIDVFGTNGVLIHRKVVSKIGVYDSKHFFVGYEDIEYALRARKNGFSIVVVREARVFHPDLMAKHPHKASLFSRIFGRDTVLAKLMPPFLGVIRTDNRKFSKAEVLGSSYIMGKYMEPIQIIICFFYSLFRVFFCKIFNWSSISFSESIKSYLNGIMQGRNNR